MAQEILKMPTRPTEDQKASEPMIKVRLLRDTWKGEERIKSGSVVDMPQMQALRAIKDGAVEPVLDDDEKPTEA